MRCQAQRAAQELAFPPRAAIVGTGYGAPGSTAEEGSMPRPPRFSYAHALHHVTLRCNNREFLFSEPTLECFAALLQEARGTGLPGARRRRGHAPARIAGAGLLRRQPPVYEANAAPVWPRPTRHPPSARTPDGRHHPRRPSPRQGSGAAEMTCGDITFVVPACSLSVLCQAPHVAACCLKVAQNGPECHPSRFGDPARSGSILLRMPQSGSPSHSTPSPLWPGRTPNPLVPTVLRRDAMCPRRSSP